MKLLSTITLLFCTATMAEAQNVGIGTNNPQARLHVSDSNVLFSGHAVNEIVQPPVSGEGTRMMWMPRKGAFRAGRVNGNQWDADKIGFMSTAVGQHNIASGQGSFAAGSYNIAAGTNSVAMGEETHADGRGSFAAGIFSEAVGANSAAIGAYARAIGNSAFAIGFNPQAFGTASYAIGHGTTASGYFETALGSFNATVNGSTSAWIPNDPLFSIGNGTSVSSRSTALMILKNGNTGIGTMAPRTKLHVQGSQLISRNSGTGSAQLDLEETQSGDGSRLRFSNTHTDNNAWELFGLPTLQNSQDAVFNMFYSPVGNVMTLRGNGNVWFRGTVSQNSDASLKTNINRITQALNKIDQLNGYTYNWKDSTRDQSLQAGVLAQEIEAVMPELVTTDASGVKSVNYSGLLPYVIEAVKEQSNIIREMQSQLAEQQQLIQELKVLVNRK